MRPVRIGHDDAVCLWPNRQVADVASFERLDNVSMCEKLGGGLMRRDAENTAEIAEKPGDGQMDVRLLQVSLLCSVRPLLNRRSC